MDKALHKHFKNQLEKVILKVMMAEIKYKYHLNYQHRGEKAVYRNSILNKSHPSH